MAMQLHGDAEGIAALKALVTEHRDYMKFLIGEARTSSNHAAVFTGADGRKWELRLKLDTGDLEVRITYNGDPVSTLDARCAFALTLNGGAVANFNMATNESWTDKSGQKQERTEWHRIVVWGKMAEICGQYLSKGRQAFVEGRLQTREWTDKEGGKRYTTEIVAQNVQFLGGGQGERAASTGAGSDFATSSDFEPAQAGGGSDFESGGKGLADDEVPF